MTSFRALRTIDDLGRVVIPSEVRRTLNLQRGDQMTCTLEGDRIVLTPVKVRCALCGEADGELVPIRERHVCKTCVEELVR